jgi:hypothetical protein
MLLRSFLLSARCSEIYAGVVERFMKLLGSAGKA